MCIKSIHINKISSHIIKKIFSKGGYFFAQTQISDSDSDLWAWSFRGTSGSTVYV